MDNWPSVLIMDDKMSLGRRLMLTGITKAVTEMKESFKVPIVSFHWALVCFRQLLQPEKGPATAVGSEVTEVTSCAAEGCARAVPLSGARAAQAARHCLCH